MYCTYRHTQNEVNEILVLKPLIREYMGKESQTSSGRSERRRKSTASSITTSKKKKRKTMTHVSTQRRQSTSTKTTLFQPIKKNVCNGCNAYNFLFECDRCLKSYCVKHMNNHKNCVLRLPRITCSVCGKDIEIPRGQTSKDVLKRHISETHRETPSEKKNTPPPSTEHVTNEWLIRLYHISYAVFMEQHDGKGLSPLSRHCLVGIVREFKFENNNNNKYDPHNMRTMWSPQALYKMISSVACVMQMSTIEIVSWGIYLCRFGWFQPGLNPMQSLAITGFSIKLFLTVDYTMFLAYLNSKWGDFTKKFNAWVTSVRLQHSPLTMIEINMKYLDYCKSFEWTPPTSEDTT